jgi:hypothetical protein
MVLGIILLTYSIEKGWRIKKTPEELPVNNPQRNWGSKDILFS